MTPTEHAAPLLKQIEREREQSIEAARFAAEERQQRLDSDYLGGRKQPSPLTPSRHTLAQCAAWHEHEAARWQMLYQCALDECAEHLCAHYSEQAAMHAGFVVACRSKADQN